MSQYQDTMKDQIKSEGIKAGGLARALMDQRGDQRLEIIQITTNTNSTIDTIDSIIFGDYQKCQ